MTQPQSAPQQSQSSRPARNEPVVNPETDSRLDQLTAEYALLKPQMEEKKERLDNVVKAIKSELAGLLQEGQESILLTSPHLTRPLRYELTKSWQVKMETFKTLYPGIYTELAKRQATWKLGPVR